MRPTRTIRNKRNNAERKEQIAFFKWLSYHPMLRDEVIFHIPNGENRSAITGYILKLMGVRKGMLDIFVAIPSRGVPGLFIEMKRPGEKLKPEQRIIVDKLRSRGYQCNVCYTSEEVINVFKAYLPPDIYVERT